MNWLRGIKISLLLVLVFFCLFEFSLYQQSRIFREYTTAILSLKWMLLVCLLLWSGAFLFLTCRWNDLLLLIFLLVIITEFFVNYSSRTAADILTFLFGVTLGKGASLLLRNGNLSEPRSHRSVIGPFLIGLMTLLGLSMCWQPDMAGSYYHGPRWKGLWDNPNTYGMLMGVGCVLAIGLFGANSQSENGRWNTKAVLILIAAGMMGVGVVMSYSRGTWLAMSIALLYLAWCYGRLKWKHVLPGAVIVTVAIWYFWDHTPNSAPWYIKRADLGRPSAQNRVVAWRAGLEIMRDHPFGVGWNNAIEVYSASYHPPEGGPLALATNDYLMVGTGLGFPVLLCFVAYVTSCYRESPKICLSSLWEAMMKAPSPFLNHTFLLQEHETLRAACLSSALVLIVAFWFDAGLFSLPTSMLFWLLLELGVKQEAKLE